jgi:hypothetical protein
VRVRHVRGRHHAHGAQRGDNAREGSRDAHAKNFTWGLVYALSAVPVTISSILKEIILCHPTEVSTHSFQVCVCHSLFAQPAEMSSLNAWVALLQVAMGLALSPLSIRLQVQLFVGSSYLAALTPSPLHRLRTSARWQPLNSAATSAMAPSVRPACDPVDALA